MIPNANLNYGFKYKNEVIHYLQITDKTLTCSVKKWSISTNYPNYFMLFEEYSEIISFQIIGK